MEEEILKSSLNRFVQDPVKKYKDLWDLYKLHQASLWQAEEIPYKDDLNSWSKLDINEQYFIKMILAFFAGADGIVLENLMDNFSGQVQIAEARAFYSIQGYMEQVHSETYSNLLDTYVTDEEEKEKLFRAIETVPCVAKKAQWAMKWMDPSYASFSLRLIGFIIVEGIFFSGAFCAIFWLKSRGLMTQSLGLSNQWIARDEALHCRFGVALYHHLKDRVSEEQVHRIFKEAVEIEKEFITDSLPCDLIGMNKVLMVEYIKYVADYWLKKLGYNKIYKTKNPFEFMTLNQIDGKTNFFEQTVSEYTKAYSSNSASKRVNNFDDNDF